MDPLLCKLKQLELTQRDYAVFGSGPLLVRGIIAASNDLDIICRGSVWEQVKARGNVRHEPRYALDIVELFDGRLTFGTRWGIGNFDVNKLIDESELIEGIPFVRLEHVIDYKLERNSQKDRSHIREFERVRHLYRSDYLH